MTERDHTGGGGLTGATGDLTFEENDRPFVTGEAREVSDAAHRGDVTAAQIRRAPAQEGATGDPGAARPEGGLTTLAESDGGYASSRGLNPDDEAYRMERHPSAGEQGGVPAHSRRRAASDDTQLGGDELTDREVHL